MHRDFFLIAQPFPAHPTDSRRTDKTPGDRRRDGLLAMATLF